MRDSDIISARNFLTLEFLGAFTVGVLLLGQVDLGVYYDLLLFD